jgi:hypothetical protein
LPVQTELVSTGVDAIKEEWSNATPTTSITFLPNCMPRNDTQDLRRGEGM